MPGSDLHAWIARLEAISGRAAPSLAPPASAWGATPGGEARRLWDLVADASATPASLEAAAASLRGEGPFRPVEESLAIEVWVDDELSLLHAAWRLSRRTGIAASRERCFAAARWHREHTGAENATHRPWAVHVFLAERSPESMLYADGLVHAVLAGGGPDEVSRWILADAARELRTLEQAAGPTVAG